MISEYNCYMGGVDLADMRHLHCNSTIMGQKRWWLKLFFYLLDVGMSNALVLFNLTQRDGQKTSMIVEFKSELIQAFLGTRLQGVPDSVVEHVPFTLMDNFAVLTVHYSRKFDLQKYGVAHQAVIFCCVLLGVDWWGKIVSQFATPIRICIKQF